jgi:hypothetical protein
MSAIFEVPGDGLLIDFGRWARWFRHCDGAQPPAPPAELLHQNWELPRWTEVRGDAERERALRQRAVERCGLVQVMSQAVKRLTEDMASSLRHVTAVEVDEAALRAEIGPELADELAADSDEHGTDDARRRVLWLMAGAETLGPADLSPEAALEWLALLIDGQPRDDAMPGGSLPLLDNVAQHGWPVADCSPDVRNGYRLARCVAAAHGWTDTPGESADTANGTKFSPHRALVELRRIETWIREKSRQAAADEGGNGAKRKKFKRRGRPKADYETEHKEAAIAVKWKQARAAGVVKADFASDIGMTVSEFDNLLGRVRARERARKRNRQSE